MAEHDLVIAPYSLLQRDRERWLQLQWHLVVLDEAQEHQNTSTNVAQVVSALQARHRLCLLGTHPWKTTWARSGACSTS